jgi:hypothetical protein
MIVCDFCINFQSDGTCRLGLKIPKKMSCREFAPTLTSFCANPTDFVDPQQITQMATYFGFKGVELKKIQVMAAQEVAERAKAPSVEAAHSL